jgi:hypothetical protein
MKTIFFTIIFWLSIFYINFALAQEQPKHEKGSYVDSLNRYYQQAELPLYIYVSHKPNQAPTQLANSDNTTNSNELKPIYLDGHGKHYLKHNDALHNAEDKFVIYADGLAPISRISLQNAPYYFAANKHYYGKGLKALISTQDEMSGIKQLYYALNQANYQNYSNTLNFDQEGNFNLKFYALDNVGNAEVPKNNDFIVDITPPKTYHNIIGINSNNIISVSTKIYLTPTDSIAGIAKTFYRLDNEPEKPYIAGAMIPFAYLPDGDHTLTYYSIDNVNNRESESTIKFYLDKSSPIMSADILGDRFIVGDKIYFSGRTKLKLTAVDNKSGIKQVKYSIDNQEFQNYEDPFYLPSKSGLHTIRYYAVDNMGNEGVGNDEVGKMDEYRHNVGVVYVDLTGPALTHQFLGPRFQKGDTTFVNSTTRINLLANDPESGLQKITYSLNGEVSETTYNQPFSVNKEGFVKIDYFGYDNVNNRNVKDISFVVDNQGPKITATFSNAPIEAIDNEEVFPSYVTLFLATTDLQTGSNDIRYAINQGKEQPYIGAIRGFDRNKNYTIRITATDLLGNVSVKEIKFRTARY